jgi:hypothetical protein
MNPTVELLNKLLKTNRRNTDIIINSGLSFKEKDLEGVNVYVREPENEGCELVFVSTLGIINGILVANNLPRVAAILEEGTEKIIGFTEKS